MPTPSPAPETSRSSSAGGSTRSRRRRLVWALSVLFLVLVAVVLLSIPLARAAMNAKAAKSDLTSAMTSLETGNLTAARTSVARARAHVNAAQHGAQSTPAKVWSKIPFVGTPVGDLRHLTRALADATSVAETGVQLYPSVAGQQATLFTSNRIDRGTLDQVIAGARKAGQALTSAQSELKQVRGSTPLIGGLISRQRDAAASQVDPVADGYTRMAPMLDVLPQFLGFDGKRSYLIAMLNPSELRYSGGAPLAFSDMSWDHGKLTMGKAYPLVQDSRLRVPLDWPKVAGNPFHAANTRIPNATFAPSWSVSGEEILRAWRSATGDQYNGVLAIDVVALADLLDATGPVTVPGVGQLDGSNLTKTLVGSYDKYYPDPTSQDQTFAGVAAALQARLFGGGSYVAKGKALKKAADGRHLALYLRDPHTQAAFATLGLDGDLTKPVGDYVGAFTQSTFGSKADYYQRRSLDLDVTLGADGAATDRLDVGVHNDTPPYAVPGTDTPPGVSSNVYHGYFTRWLGVSAAAFLPGTAKVESFSLAGGNKWDGKVGTFYDHSFVQDQALLRPGASTTLRASYTVPKAATKGDSGALTYRLAMDPQGMVNPASARVTVHLPEGYHAASLPEGWTSSGSTLTFTTDTLAASTSWDIPLAKN